MNKLILASQSPRRAKLLKESGFSFDIEISEYEEDMSLDLIPSQLVQELARGKAREVADKHTGDDRIILGADSIVIFNDQIIGKPRDDEDARQTLALLSGNTHYDLTGVVLINTKTGEKTSFFVKIAVTFRVLSKQQIEEYVATGSPLDKAGSYGLQDADVEEFFIEKIEGDRTTAIGLPIEETIRQLRKFGVLSET